MWANPLGESPLVDAIRRLPLDPCSWWWWNHRTYLFNVGRRSSITSSSPVDDEGPPAWGAENRWLSEMVFPLKYCSGTRRVKRGVSVSRKHSSRFLKWNQTASFHQANLWPGAPTWSPPGQTFPSWPRSPWRFQNAPSWAGSRAAGGRRWPGPETAVGRTSSTEHCGGEGERERLQLKGTKVTWKKINCWAA